MDSKEAEHIVLEASENTLYSIPQHVILRKVLPEGLSKRYFSEELKRCAALRSAPDRAEHERVYYFNAI